MEDIRTVLQSHKSKTKEMQDKPESVSSNGRSKPSTSEIPDLFFDRILVEYKLKRVDIMCLMYLYRSVWCRPNTHRIHGISPMLDMKKVAQDLCISFDELYRSVGVLEGAGFIETIRSGQYFVRKYFTEKLDREQGISYDNFL
jgi:hypothetical protein